MHAPRPFMLGWKSRNSGCPNSRALWALMSPPVLLFQHLRGLCPTEDLLLVL